MDIPAPDNFNHHSYIQRYYCGEWRALIFRDLILDEAKRINKKDELVFLDIGCGCGFDNNLRLQAELSKVASKYIGIEPNAEIKLGDFFSETYRCTIEDAPISRESVDIAFSIMVLEHIAEPIFFWDKVYEILRPGGTFWGFTMDARHYFVWISSLLDKFGIKDSYLNFLHGKRSHGRYENYKTYYRCNTPHRIAVATKRFRKRHFLNFYRIGQLDYYIPVKLRWLLRCLDRLAIRMGFPGSVMAVRLVK